MSERRVLKENLSVIYEDIVNHRRSLIDIGACGEIQDDLKDCVRSLYSALVLLTNEIRDE